MRAAALCIIFLFNFQSIAKTRRAAVTVCASKEDVCAMQGGLGRIAVSLMRKSLLAFLAALATATTTSVPRLASATTFGPALTAPLVSTTKSFAFACYHFCLSQRLHRKLIFLRNRKMERNGKITKKGSNWRNLSIKL